VAAAAVFAQSQPNSFTATLTIDANDGPFYPMQINIRTNTQSTISVSGLPGRVYAIFQTVGIRGVAFADGGNAFNRQDPFADKLEALRFAWGFGIRWFSPIGPLRFEWGFPFAPTEEEASSVFEFSIGNFF